MPTPSVENLSLFKGIVKFMLNTETEFRDLGECDEFTTAINVDTLEYVSKRHSSRIPVKIFNLGKTMTLALTMAEAAQENLELWLLAKQEGSPGFLSIGTADEKRGWLRFVGTNEVGNAYQVDLPDVSLRPNGDLSWLTDNTVSTMQFQGSVFAAPTGGEFGTVRAIAAGIEEPTGSPAI